MAHLVDQSIIYNQSDKRSKVSRFPLERLLNADDYTTVRPDARSETTFFKPKANRLAILDDLATVVGVGSSSRRRILSENIVDKKQTIHQFGNKNSRIKVVHGMCGLDQLDDTVLVGYANGRAVQYSRDSGETGWVEDKNYGDLGIGSMTASFQEKGLVIFSRGGSDKVRIVNCVDKEILGRRPLETGVYRSQFVELKVCSGDRIFLSATGYSSNTYDAYLVNENIDITKLIRPCGYSVKYGIIDFVGEESYVSDSKTDEHADHEERAQFDKDKCALAQQIQRLRELEVVIELLMGSSLMRSDQPNRDRIKMKLKKINKEVIELRIQLVSLTRKFAKRNQTQTKRILKSKCNGEIWFLQKQQMK